MTNFASAKDYDAIVTVRLDHCDATFALEYERSAKSKAHYAGICNRIDSEADLDKFLYLASSEEVLRFVSWQFRYSKRSICFGLLGDWYHRLLDTEVFDWNYHQYRPLRATLSSSPSSVQPRAATLP